MDIESIEFELVRLSEMVGIGQFDEALNGIDTLYAFINKNQGVSVVEIPICHISRTLTPWFSIVRHLVP